MVSQQFQLAYVIREVATIKDFLHVIRVFQLDNLIDYLTSTQHIIITFIKASNMSILAWIFLPSIDDPYQGIKVS